MRVEEETDGNSSTIGRCALGSIPRPAIALGSGEVDRVENLRPASCRCAIGRAALWYQQIHRGENRSLRENEFDEENYWREVRFREIWRQEVGRTSSYHRLTCCESSSRSHQTGPPRWAGYRPLLGQGSRR
jgi:hypothetical protein